MSRRFPAVALVAGLLAGPAAPTPTAPPNPPDPLAQALQAADHLNFTGTVIVDWVDAAGRHRTTLDVSGVGGVVDVDGPVRLVADEEGRLVESAAGWTLLWPTGDLLATMLSRSAEKYQLGTSPGPDVAGRQTTAVTLTVAGQTREEVVVDAATGLPLQRAVFNPDGSFVRLVSFSSLTLGGVSTVAPATPRVARRALPRVAPARLAAPFEAPLELAAGYHRLGVYQSGEGLQVLYSDGIDSLSVFEQPGTLRPGSLPAAAARGTIGHAPAAEWVWPGGQVATWQNGPAVFTAVGDGPLADLVAAAGSLPAGRPLSWSQRLRHACRRLVSDLVGK